MCSQIECYVNHVITIAKFNIGTTIKFIALETEYAIILHFIEEISLMQWDSEYDAFKNRLFIVNATRFPLRLIFSS